MERQQLYPEGVHADQGKERTPIDKGGAMLVDSQPCRERHLCHGPQAWGTFDLSGGDAVGSRYCIRYSLQSLPGAPEWCWTLKTYMKDLGGIQAFNIGKLKGDMVTAVYALTLDDKVHSHCEEAVWVVFQRTIS